jgi:AcrR family transcriptional regulator
MPRNLSATEVDAFRARLCAAAQRRFARHGAEGVSMRGLADELGCSPMTPYRYFRDKDEILAAVRAAAFDRFADALEAAARKTAGDLRAAGQATGEAYVRFALSDPEAYRLMFDLSQPHPERYPELVRASARARHMMSAALEGLVKAGIFAGDAQVLGCVFWATMHGLVVLRLAGKLPETPDFETIRREAMRLLVIGARAGADAPAAPAAAPRRKRRAVRARRRQAR